MPSLSKKTISASEESAVDSPPAKSSPAAKPKPSKSKKQSKSAEKVESSSSSSPSSSSSSAESSSSDSGSDSDSDSDSDSSSDSDNGEKQETQSKAMTNASTRYVVSPTHPPRLSINRHSSNTQPGSMIPAKPFKPPVGFKKITNYVARSTEASQIFSNLEGKQLWHIAAPASVPISSIQTLALDAIATGEPVFSHKGSQYRLREEQISTERSKSLFIPDVMGNTYHKSPQPIVQTFHAEEVIGLPGTETPAQQIEKYIKPVRQQPRNLRGRHTPLGSTKTSKLPQQLPGDAPPATKDTDAAGEDNIGDREEQIEKSKKRKHADKHSPRKKSKLDAELPQRGKKDDGKEEEKGKNKSHKSKHRDETSEARKARSEEKKRKKEAKAAK